MKEGTVNLPNVLSLSRIPLGVLVAISAAKHAWMLALVLLFIAMATDVLDGWVAKAQSSGTKFGADVLEPVCDLAMTAGALTGLLIAHRLAWSAVIAFAAVGVTVQLINSFMTDTVLFRGFGVWFMPMFFLALIWLLGARYADLAIHGTALVIFASVYTVVTISLIKAKRHRFKAWFHGNLGVA